MDMEASGRELLGGKFSSFASGTFESCMASFHLVETFYDLVRFYEFLRGWRVSTSCGESVAKGHRDWTLRFLTRKPLGSPLRKISTRYSSKAAALPFSAQVLVTKNPTRSPLPKPGSGLS